MQGEPKAYPGKDYWHIGLDQLLRHLDTTVSGLTAAEAFRRQRWFGPNTAAHHPSSAADIFLRQFTNPLLLILLIAAALAFFLKEWVDAAIVLIILLSSTLLVFLQEFRASLAAQTLRRRLDLRSNVLRDGAAANIRASDLVPGDVLLLASGDLIPADGRLLEAVDFLVSEASISGESFPVEKRPDAVPAETPLITRSNIVYQGSSVRSGTAKVVIVATGRSTVFGRILHSSAQGRRETEFSHGIRRFGSMLLRVAILIVFVVFMANVVADREVFESLLFAVALAVGLSPELLPAIISITLSRGAQALAHSGVLVRRLTAIENLGLMDVLCTDKTGTLTSGQTELYETLDASGLESKQVLKFAFLNAHFETGISNPLDKAIIAAGKKVLLTDQGARKLDEIPYDFARRRLTIVTTDPFEHGKYLMVTKGSFLNVLDICDAVIQDGQRCFLTPKLRARLIERYEQKGRDGFRVLALAIKHVDHKRDYTKADECGLTFMGYLIFYDPPKKDAEKVLESLKRLGVEIKIITGDSRYVTGHLAAAVGLDCASMLTGQEISQLRDEALWVRVKQTRLFVEVDPQQKERIVRALQRSGHCVGYLGDGINDVPALEAADVGISVRGAVDVARESADIVLVRTGLEVLKKGVEEGRRIAVNTLKYLTITTSANFGNMISMALATPFLPFLALAPKQILLNNFLSDFPAIFIASDKVDNSQIQKPVHWDVTKLRRSMIAFGLQSSLFDVLSFAVLLLIFQVSETEFQTAWFLISLATELAMLFILRTHYSAFKSSPSLSLCLLSIIVASTAVGLVTVPSLLALFGFTAPSTSMWLLVLFIVVLFSLTAEGLKRFMHVSGYL